MFASDSVRRAKDNCASRHCSILCSWARVQGRKLERAGSSRKNSAQPRAEGMLERKDAEEDQAKLLRRISNGDSEAVAEFYDQTAGPLFSVAARILGDTTEAEEVIQDVFLQIWEKAGSFDPMRGSAFHWSLSIARHRSIDRLRSRQRRARLLDELIKEAPGSPPQNSQDESTLSAEDSAAVRTALRTLPSEQQEAIELAFFGGKTHLEIAEALNEPLGTIKARIRRGMLKLRDSLQALV